MTLTNAQAALMAAATQASRAMGNKWSTEEVHDEAARHLEWLSSLQTTTGATTNAVR